MAGKKTVDVNLSDLSFLKKEIKYHAPPAPLRQTVDSRIMERIQDGIPTRRKKRKPFWHNLTPKQKSILLITSPLWIIGVFAMATFWTVTGSPEEIRGYRRRRRFWEV